MALSIEDIMFKKSVPRLLGQEMTQKSFLGLFNIEFKRERKTAIIKINCEKPLNNKIRIFRLHVREPLRTKKKKIKLNEKK